MQTIADHYKQSAEQTNSRPATDREAASPYLETKTAARAARVIDDGCHRQLTDASEGGGASGRGVAHRFRRSELSHL